MFVSTYFKYKARFTSIKMKIYLYQLPNTSTKHYLQVTFLALFLSFGFGCTPNKTTKKEQIVSAIQITPAPVKILYKRDFFNLDKSSRVLLNLADDRSNKAGEYLINEIKNKTSYKLKIADRFTTIKIPSGIELIIGQNKTLRPEGFKLVISTNRIKIIANDPNGIHYAINVVLDLLKKNQTGWSSPQLSIEDYPKAQIRTLYINNSDSMSIDHGLIQLLVKNRINNLILAEEWDNDTNEFIKIGDTTLLAENWRTHLIEGNKAQEFYRKSKQIGNQAIFKINDSHLLKADSLIILGEALWTNSKNLNYKKLINHLETRQSH